MHSRLDDGDREGALIMAERLQKLGKTLKDRQNKFEDGLPKLLTSEEVKDYKRWKKDAEQAAEDRRRQEAPRWREGGSRGYPGGGRFGVGGGRGRALAG